MAVHTVGSPVSAVIYVSNAKDALYACTLDLPVLQGVIQLLEANE